MDTAKMCHNAVLHGRPHPLHTRLVTFEPTHNFLETAFHVNAGCLATGLKNSGLYDPTF